MNDYLIKYIVQVQCSVNGIHLPTFYINQNGNSSVVLLKQIKEMFKGSLVNNITMRDMSTGKLI